MKRAICILLSLVLTLTGLAGLGMTSGAAVSNGVRPAGSASVAEGDARSASSEPDDGGVMNAQLYVPRSTTIKYKNIVIVTATATGVPDGCTVAIYEGGALLQNGDNKSVAYDAGRMKAGRTFTVRIIDANGNVQWNADGKLEKHITVSVKKNYFTTVAAIIQGLFGIVPRIVLKP